MSSDEQLDARLKAIAQAAAPGPSMVDDVMHRIEQESRACDHASSALPEDLHHPSEPRVSGHRYRRLIRRLIPIAAAAVVAGFLFFPSTASKNIAWADVAERMRRARTMVCEEESRQGAFLIYGRGFLKDPCFRRAEDYSSTGSQPPKTDGQPERILISGVGGDPNLSVTWQPRAMAVTWRQNVNCTPEKPAAAFTWDLLRRIRADQTSQVGTDKINGEPTVVFGIPVEKFYRTQVDPETRPVGTVRVWVSEATHLPIQFEQKYRVQRTGQDSGEVYSRIYNMQWDVPLSDDLFKPPVFDPTWRQTTERTICYQGKTLTPGTTLRVGPPDGPPVIAEKDVEPLEGFEVLNSSGQPQGMSRFSFRLTKEASERFHAFTAAHIGGTITTSFNGEELDEFTVKRPAWWQGVNLPLSSMDLTVEQFEARYLTSRATSTGPIATHPTTVPSASRPANESSTTKNAVNTLEFRIVPNLADSRRAPVVRDYSVLRSDCETRGPATSAINQDGFQWFEVADTVLNVGGRNMPELARYKNRKYLILCARNLIVDGVAHPTAMLAESQDESGWGLTQASAGLDPMGHPALYLQLNEAGAQLMKRLTAANIGNSIAVLVDGKIVSIAVIRSEVGDTCQLTGSFTAKEINRLATILRRANYPASTTQPASTRPQTAASDAPRPSF